MCLTNSLHAYNFVLTNIYQIMMQTMFEAFNIDQLTYVKTHEPTDIIYHQRMPQIPTIIHKPSNIHECFELA